MMIQNIEHNLRKKLALKTKLIFLYCSCLTLPVIYIFVCVSKITTNILHVYGQAFFAVEKHISVILKSSIDYLFIEIDSLTINLLFAEVVDRVEGAKRNDVAVN